ncbi:MurR/RpiR family transcriptional regulator [Collinsella vaginalis]|uniref:MurR/RpiR family transcriptional regulator n=1 Tax=Collinsella vaginalis TaxID=1870987 RepID=UPI000A27033C|nr:MurR/RpiR family transcriptional regulator [Collinsella vaginalis]
MGTLDHLDENRGLSATERVIARYVMEHPEECSRISSRELARRTYTSATAVLRFCRKLGYANYGDFKVNIVFALKSVSFTNTMIVDGESALGAMSKIASLETQIIEETRRAVSPAVLEAVSDALAACRYVDMIANDANAEMARYASHNLFYMGKICTIYDDLDKMTFLALNPPDMHMAFVISKSGRDRSILTAARLLRSSGVEVVALTADTDSPLAQESSHVLEGFYYPELDKFGDLVFGAAAKYLFDVLFVMQYARDTKRVQALNDAYDELYYRELNRDTGENER